MGGKQKQAHRTKDNARPSSSGRSAALLGNSSGSGKTLTLVKDNLYVTPGQKEVALPEISQDFQLAMKKFNKKDPITRQKGLKEFSDLLEKASPAEAKAVLPYWPPFYNMAVSDIDYRVREAAQNAHRVIVMKVKRDIAPYLKKLMGSWFVSPFDSHTGTANIARNTFETAFSSSKRTEVIMFARNEILTYIARNIIDLTPQSLSNGQNHAAEDVELRYQRVLSANLLGYAHYLEKLPKDELLKVKEDNQRLIINVNKFWKIAHDDCKSVKCGWFTVILALMEKAPSFLENSHKELCLAIFKNFDDNDTNVLPLIWESVLECCATVPNWWTYVSLEKLVYPKLWHVLETAGFGNAFVLFPILVQMISKIIVPTVTSSKDFYTKFFAKMKEGISTVKVMRNSSDNNVYAPFFDCLKHMLYTNSDDIEVYQSLTNSLVISLLKDALYGKNVYGVNSSLYINISGLVRYYIRIRIMLPIFGELVKYLMNSIQNTLENSIDAKGNNLANMSESELELRLKIHFKLISMIKNPTYGNCKQLKKVRYAEEDDEEKYIEIENRDGHFLSVLHKFVKHLIRVYYKFSLKKNHVHLFINQICQILNLFGEKCLYQYLADVVEESSKSEMHTQPSEKINNLIQEWLKIPGVLLVDVLNVVFHLMFYFKDEEKTLILDSISEEHMSSMLDTCFVLADRNQLMTSVQKWLHGPYFRNMVQAFSNDICCDEHPSPEKVKILKACFKIPKDKDQLTTNETKLEVLKMFCKSFSNDDNFQPGKENLSCMADVLMAALQEHNYPLLRAHSPIFINIIGYFYWYGCNVDSYITEDDIVNKTWKIGVKTLMMTENYSDDIFQKLVECFAYALIEHIDKNEHSTIDIPYMVDTRFCAFIQCIPTNVVSDEYKSWDEVINGICDHFMRVFVQYCHTNMEKDIVNSCLAGEYIDGSLTYKYEKESPQLDDEMNDNTDFEDCFAGLPKLYHVAICMVQIMMTNVPQPEKENTENVEVVDTEKEKENKQDLNSVHLDRLKITHVYVSYVIYLTAVFESFKRNFKQTKYYHLISDQDISDLLTMTRKLIKYYPENAWVLLKITVMNKAFDHGCYWAKALNVLFYELLNVNKMNDNFLEVLKCSEVTEIRDESYVLHVSEVLSTKIKIDISQYAPEVLIDKAKLSVLSCYLRSNPSMKFSTEYDRVIWFWLDTILIHKKQLQATFNTNLVECSVADIMKAATVCRFLAVISDGRIPLMTAIRTDFMMVSLASWIKSIQITSASSYPDGYSLPIAIFTSAVCDMFTSLSRLATYRQYSEKLSDEWVNVFQNEAQLILANKWKYLADNSDSTVEYYLTQKVFCKLMFNNMKFVLNVTKADHVYWFSACSELIRSHFTSTKIAAYFFLIELCTIMVEQDLYSPDIDSPNGKLSIEKLPFLSLTKSIEDMLKKNNPPLGELPLASAGCVHSYLLVWVIVLRMCEKATAQLRYKYAVWLKENKNKYLDCFLADLLSLMETKYTKVNLSDLTIEKYRENFSNELSILPDEQCDIERIELLVTRLYYKCHWLLPFFVRSWWKSLAHKEADVVERLTTRYVTPSLILEEMKAVTSEKEDDKFSMKAIPKMRQIVASYTVEDTKMEITMELAANHPLDIVKIDGGNKSGIILNQKTFKQLNKYLSCQNGLVRDGIIMWKTNMAKKFEGLEECHICFSIVNSVDYQLPKNTCKTCNKKYHSLCLYRWFKSSTKSTCPICRSLF